MWLLWSDRPASSVHILNISVESGCAILHPPRRLAAHQAELPLGSERCSHETEATAVAIASGQNERPQILAIGEAQYSSDVRAMHDVHPLEDIHNLVVSAHSTNFNIDEINLMPFSANGFEPEALRARDHRTELILVDLVDLYARS